MDGATSGTDRPARRFSWPNWLDNWRLRTKVTVVLLVPVIVALVLGGLRVQSQWDEASRLSSVRDQVSVLRGVIDLASLVDKETVTAVAATPPEGLDIRVRIAAVDKQAAAVQGAADAAGLPPDVGRSLSAAIGRLGALRSAGTGDPVATTAAYHEVVGELSEVVTGVVASADSSDLDTAANSVRLLLQLHSTLAEEEGMLRSVEQGSLPAITIAGAQRAAAEESVLNQQLGRAVHGDTAVAFANATTSAPSRRDVLDAALSIDLTAELRGLLPGIESELTALDDVLSGYVGALSDQITARTTDARNSALRDAAIVLGALIVALVIALLVARSVVAPMRRLHRAVRRAAEHELPDTVQRIMAGEQVDWRTVEPVPVTSSEEIGQLARGFDEMHQQAVRMAAEQADLRRQVSEMFMTLSRRSQSLVELQLNEIESLESQEQDPQRLDSLFRLDHLATRLRRNGENLQVLAGGAPQRREQGAVTVIELLRAATSAVKDYRRVNVGHAAAGLVRGHAAADIVHILAELLENATRYSPPEHRVVLIADRGSDGGLLIEVIDRGLGMAPEDLKAANDRLAATGLAGPETTRRMGLFVVSKLAERHGVTVRLRPTSDAAIKAGITASVHVPGELVVAGGIEPTVAAQPAKPTFSEPARPASQPAPDRPTNGQVAPKRAPATPIFDQLASRWFTEVPDPEQPAPEQPPSPQSPAAPVVPQQNPATAAPARQPEWNTAADAAWLAAGAVSEPPSPAATTQAGLPVRQPGARLVPGGPAQAVVGKPANNASGSSNFRDAAAVRNNLSRHYDGMRRARQRTTAEPDKR